MNAADANGITALGWAVFGSNTKCVDLLLMEGVHIRNNEITLNVWDSFQCTPDKEIRCLLLAAGYNLKMKQMDIGDTLKTYSEVKLDLKGISRSAIRTHLLTIRPVNLFTQISLLNLPSSLSRYLLYGITVYREDKDDDTDAHANQSTKF